MIDHVLHDLVERLAKLLRFVLMHGVVSSDQIDDPLRLQARHAPASTHSNCLAFRMGFIRLLETSHKCAQS